MSCLLREAYLCLLAASVCALEAEHSSPASLQALHECRSPGAPDGLGRASNLYTCRLQALLMGLTPRSGAGTLSLPLLSPST